MNVITKATSVAVLIALGLALGARAAEPAAGKAWTLTTEDTELTLTVTGNTLSIVKLRNPAQGWNWTPAPSPVPLPGVNGKQVAWTFRDAAETKTNGHVVTLRFTCAEPALELQSVWRARPGVGPVEHQQTVRNDTAGTVSFADADLVAAQLDLVSDQEAHLFPVAGGNVGYGERTPLPFQMIQVGAAHGVYLAYDYGCGKFASTVTGNRIASRWWAAGIRNTATPAGKAFRCPGIMIQAYQGDEDDGANHFRRWFWTYEITPALRANPQEPPVVTAYAPPEDGMADYLIQQVKTRNFAAMGIGLLKTDVWYNRTGHAKSAELAAACHEHGLKLGLYWDGHIPLETLKAEFDKSRFDFYRMDQYQRGVPFHVNDYHSVKAFNEKIDAMIAHGAPNWRLENCCNGGNLRTLDLCRRMTFMTHSDDDSFPTWFKHVYHWSYLICPIQLRNDYNTGGEGKPFGKKRNVATARGLLLGACYTGSPSWWTPDDLALVTELFRRYNTRQRAILRGADVYRILPPPTPGRWCGLQYFNPAINKGSVLLWQNGGPASQVVKLKGLDRAATYALAFEDAPEKNGARTGAQLMDEGIAVSMGTNKSEIIWINCDVTAAITVDTVRGEQPLPVRFDGSGSSSSSGKIVSYEWDFGDGATAREVATAHTYDKPGRYKVRLTVRDDHGKRDTASASVTVLPTDTVAPEINAVKPVRSDRVVVAFSEPVLKVDAESAANYAIKPDVKVPAVSLGDDGRTVTLTTSPLSRGIEYALTARNIRDHARKPNAVAPDARTTFRYFGLYGRWKLDDGSGRAAADVSGNGLGGQLQGGVGWSARNGRVAASFDGGKNSVMAIPGSKETLVLPFTISFRVNPAAQKSATMFAPGEGKPFSMLFRAEQGLETAGVSGSEGAEEYLGVVIENDGSINLLVGLGDRQENLEDAPKSVSLAVGQWQDVALTFNDRKAVCYVDGKENGSVATKALLARLSEPACKLGQRITIGRQFRGLLSDVRIYRLALSAAEVQAAGKGG